MGIPTISLYMLAELVSEVSHYKRVNLGEREAYFLARIGEGLNSSYRIFSFLKNAGLPMDYKNVNKRVRRLQELGLIKEIKAKGESIHNAKFFSLTSEGIFYLLTQWQPVSWKWLIEYKNNLILKVLLYPYFEENTIKPFIVLVEIGRYLRECCHLILLVIDVIIKERLVREDNTQLKKVIRQLQIDLEWQAKALAFKLVVKKTRYLYQHFQYPGGYLFIEKPKDPSDKDYFGDPIEYSLLVKDKKFMALSKDIGKEYEQAFSDLIKSARKNE
jgi:hypothetical protein